MERELGTDTARTLVKYEGVVSLTKQQAEEIIVAIWPKAPMVERLKAAILCQNYGLNPLMKHVFLIPFKNKETHEITWELVLGIKATRLIASRDPNRVYSYMDGTPRIMTPEEQERTFGKVDEAIVAITIIKSKDGAEARGYGRWPKNQEARGEDKGNTRVNMAFIRSERNALDKLYPGAMPAGVQVVDEAYVEGSVREVEPLPELPELETLPPEILPWDIVREKVRSLKLREEQLANWFRVAYEIEVTLADFEQEKAPRKFTPVMLSRLMDRLIVYEEKTAK